MSWSEFKERLEARHQVLHKGVLEMNGFASKATIENRMKESCGNWQKVRGACR
jgi:hypothetical protein